jgi:hypothetical protein
MAQAGLELKILLLSLPRSGITGMYHHTWLNILFIIKNVLDLLGGRGNELYFAVLEIETRASHMLGKCFTTKLLP